jgi:hypothetical protein
MRAAQNISGGSMAKAKRKELGLTKLMEAAWQVFKRVLPLQIIIWLLDLGVLVGGLILTAGFAFLAYKAPGIPLKVLGGTIAALVICAMVTLLIWFHLAVVWAVQNPKAELGESLDHARSKVGLVTWACLLAFLIFCGASVFGGVPGLIAGLWMIFAVFILMKEDVGGFEALLKSRVYLRGYGWAVAGIMILLVLASAVVSSIWLVGGLLGLAFGTYQTAFLNGLYERLKKVSTTKSRELLSWERPLFIGMAVAGICLFVALLVIAYFYALPEISSFNWQDKLDTYGKFKLIKL